MENFEILIEKHLFETTGAACFRDKVTGSPHCYNGLTITQAKEIAMENNLILISWNQGKTCVDVDCG